MRITNGIIASCILGIISAADQHVEMRCRARPGCHLAKCDPGLLSHSLTANEYPVTCVRTSVQDGEECNELKREIKIIQADITSYASRISTLENENKKTTSEMQALKSNLSKSDESNKELLMELNALRIKTNDLESHLAKPKPDLGRSCNGTQLESALARNGSGGVFKLDIPVVGITNVFCDVTDDGGNWTVFQRRMNGNVDFYRNWDDYVKGFGDLQGDHWLGLEAMHQLTKAGNTELKIKMISKRGIHSVAKYSNFSISHGSDFYRLHISGWSGNATKDSLVYHNDSQFSTKDVDHDGHLCASHFEGAWWYNYCARSNLNGNFNETGNKGFWWEWISNPLLFSEMKLRKRL